MPRLLKSDKWMKKTFYITDNEISHSKFSATNDDELCFSSLWPFILLHITISDLLVNCFLITVAIVFSFDHFIVPENYQARLTFVFYGRCFEWRVLQSAWHPAPQLTSWAEFHKWCRSILIITIFISISQVVFLVLIDYNLRCKLFAYLHLILSIYTRLEKIYRRIDTIILPNTERNTIPTDISMAHDKQLYIFKLINVYLSGNINLFKVSLLLVILIGYLE